MIYAKRKQICLMVPLFSAVVFFNIFTHRPRASQIILQQLRVFMQCRFALVCSLPQMKIQNLNKMVVWSFLARRYQKTSIFGLFSKDRLNKQLQLSLTFNYAILSQDLLKTAPLRVIILSKAKNTKRKQMNYSIDIHYTTPDFPERQGESIYQEHQEKDMLIIKSKNSKKIKGKKGNFAWTIKEQRSYVNFLKSERELFRLSPKERKIVKINLQMSAKVKTRTAPQCHSHHQKMMKKYGTIQGIISATKHLFSKAKKQEMKQDEEEASLEHQIPEKPHVSKEAVEVSQQEDSKRPIWWYYLDLMDVSPDELEFHASSFDSNANL